MSARTVSPFVLAAEATRRAHGRLRHALLRIRGALLMVAVASLFINLLAFASPLYMMQVYDRVLSSRSEATLLVLTVLTFGMLTIFAILDWLRSLILIRMGARFDAELSGTMFEAAFRRSLRRGEGHRARALSDLDTVRGFIAGPNLPVFFDLPWAPLFIIVVYLLHPALGHTALIGAVLLFIITFATEMLTRKPLAEATQASMAAGAFAESSLRNAEVIEAMGMLGAIRGRWAKRRRIVNDRQLRAADRNAVLASFTRFVRLVLQMALLGIGAYLAIEREISPGMMIAASIIMTRALAPVEQVVGTWRNVIGARAAWHRLADALRELGDDQERVALPAPLGQLSVERVVAAPAGSPVPVVKGVSFRLEPGESLAIIGPSGSGKSTLARLLVGVLLPGNGTVRLDGADIAQWNRDALGTHVGYLPQDVELFDGTVAENICRFGEPDSEAIVAAAQMAGVHEMILRLPNGYETHIGEGGGSLSGGQRQRLALARAVYKLPAMIVLDEPNSNLDHEGEAALTAAVARLKALKITVVAVSHRPAFVARFDKVLVLRDGTIEAMGAAREILPKLQRPAAAPVPARVVPMAEGSA